MAEKANIDNLTFNIPQGTYTPMNAKIGGGGGSRCEKRNGLSGMKVEVAEVILKKNKTDEYNLHVEGTSQSPKPSDDVEGFGGVKLATWMPIDGVFSDKAARPGQPKALQIIDFLVSCGVSLAQAEKLVPLGGSVSIGDINKVLAKCVGKVSRVALMAETNTYKGKTTWQSRISKFVDPKAFSAEIAANAWKSSLPPAAQAFLEGKTTEATEVAEVEVESTFDDSDVPFADDTADAAGDDLDAMFG